MTPRLGYKILWQEAKQEIERLKTTINNLRVMNNRLAAALTSDRSDRSGTVQIVDLAGIARHMHVERFTPQQWKQRDLLPPVDFPEIKEPLWYASTIKKQFAEPTGRPWYDRAPDNGLAPDEGLSPAA